jgi:hypothetical protein
MSRCVSGLEPKAANEILARLEPPECELIKNFLDVTMQVFLQTKDAHGGDETSMAEIVGEVARKLNCQRAEDWFDEIVG